MSQLARIALRSFANRWLTAALTVLAVALSVMLLLGVEKVRTGAKSSFANTISGTDLIVGARTGQVQLLLYSVFRIGSATATITWQSYEEIAGDPSVAWSVPLSLGDSHRGFRVLGTTGAYVERYRYRADRQLASTEREPLPTCSTRCRAPMSPRRSAIGSATRSSSRTASAPPASRRTTTSHSG